MRLVGQPSWSWSTSSANSLELALYVRDALALDIGDGAPPLTGSIPTATSAATPAELREAPAQWPSWWEALVARELWLQAQKAAHPSSPGDRDFFDAFLQQTRDAGMPPDFEGLSDRPALQRAALRLARAATVRANAMDSAPEQPLPPIGFAWVAERRRRLVAPPRARGRALLRRSRNGLRRGSGHRP